MGAQIVDNNIEGELNTSKKHILLISILIFLTVVAISYCIIFMFRQLFLTKKLKMLASIDPMTSCINRREMYSRINKLTEQVSGAVLMLDIDHFKNINDNYGHAAGDQVIKNFAKGIKANLRDQDWIARIGGEEFLIWLPNTNQKEALVIATLLCQKTAQSPIKFNDLQIDYSVSIGLFSFNGDSPSKFDYWVKKADECLFKAKQEGRNRVVS